MNMHSTWHATPIQTSSSDLLCDDDDVLLNIIFIHLHEGKRKERDGKGNSFQSDRDCQKNKINK